MSSASWRPQTPTGVAPLDPTGDFRPQTHSFVESRKSFKYTMACGHTIGPRSLYRRSTPIPRYVSCYACAFSVTQQVIMR